MTSTWLHRRGIVRGYFAPCPTYMGEPQCKREPDVWGRRDIARRKNVPDNVLWANTDGMEDAGYTIDDLLPDLNLPNRSSIGPSPFIHTVDDRVQ